MTVSWGATFGVLVVYVLAVVFDIGSAYVRWNRDEPTALVPITADVFLLTLWSVAMGYLGGRRRTGGFIGHALGIASLAGLTGFRGSSVADSDAVAGAIAACVLATLVVVGMGVAWGVGRVGRLVFRRRVVDASDSWSMWIQWPFLLWILRWFN